MVEDAVRVLEYPSIFVVTPERLAVIRERSLEAVEMIRALAPAAKASGLRKMLRRAKDPSLTSKLENEYAKELDKLFLAFKQSAAKLLGRRELSDDWDEVDAPDLMEKFNRTIEVTITIPGKGIVKRFTTRAYTAGGLRSSQFLSSLGIKATFSILPADQGAINILLTRDLSGLKGITDEMSKQIMAEITDGMLRGDSMDTVARAIDDRVDSIGRTRAEVLARTETMKAFNEGALTQYDKHGITEVEWLAAPGGPTDRTCDECLSYDGERYAMDSKPDLPAHPNCRCVWLPVIPEIAKE
jgi:SPP1 gp7 family putative phage head morphogenesis protein